MQDQDAPVSTRRDGPDRPRAPRSSPPRTLFTTRGFSPTSTRTIAEAVGIRQASLYNHFATKNDILVALLEDTVEPTLDFDDNLDPTLPPEMRLCALAWFDTAQLSAADGISVRSTTFRSFAPNRSIVSGRNVGN